MHLLSMSLPSLNFHKSSTRVVTSQIWSNFQKDSIPLMSSKMARSKENARKKKEGKARRKREEEERAAAEAAAAVAAEEREESDRVSKRNRARN